MDKVLKLIAELEAKLGEIKTLVGVTPEEVKDKDSEDIKKPTTATGKPDLIVEETDPIKEVNSVSLK
ncbi:hypothetical protein M0R04_12235 [Candidatus Dojkabacteria bacterium]|jgi:hypothetical protein|nr:hypothetical protein [Candidatus Dojkabacteria bacterium]